MRVGIVLVLTVLSIAELLGQNTTVKGIIRDDNGEALISATIHEKNTSNATYSNNNGYYELTLSHGKKTIVFSYIGYLKQEFTIDLKPNTTKELNIVLKADPLTTLDDAVIIGKSNVRLVEETGFNVVAIDATPYHNATVNLSQVLDRTPGVKINQEGGLGSNSNVTINGLSGRHVRFFIDGMPMDAMSSAFQLNNLPVNMAERIEVYKGVVPVNFGSDALGGAVNIVTKKTPGTYVDASYSYGSFNTHLTFLNAGHTSKNGFTVQLSAYQNYSDNNYFVDVYVVDFSTRLTSKEEQHVRRFHDTYHNETAIAKIGFVNKPFADQLLFGFTLGQEYRDIQHPAYINNVFGEKFYTSTTVMPSFLYSKENLFIENLDIKLAANFNLGNGHNVDTSLLDYNWLGEIDTFSVANPTKGEMQHSDYLYKDNNGTINANINYRLLKNQRITVNNVTNFLSREGDDRAVNDDFMNQHPQVNNRNILGISLNSDFSSQLSTSIFAKMYSFKASAHMDTTINDGDNYVEITQRRSKWGYGFTTTYFVNNNLQLKANFELTHRMPVSEELFGLPFLEPIINVNLKPESSQNFNIGFNLNQPLNRRNFLNADVNLFYRNTSDFIKRNVDRNEGEQTYENISLVRTTGIDAEIRYSYANRFTCGGNISYQKPMNYDTTNYHASLYKSIVPNQPNFFGNADATYFINDLGIKESKMSLTYNLQYIKEFMNDWSNYRAAESIPTQWSHNVSIVYSWKQGTYNISLGCKNIFDAKLYDNFTLQKPGRSFSAKFRFYFHKN